MAQLSVLLYTLRGELTESLTRTRFWRLSPSFTEPYSNRKSYQTRMKNKFDASVRACRSSYSYFQKCVSARFRPFVFFVGQYPSLFKPGPTIAPNTIDNVKTSLCQNHVHRSKRVWMALRDIFREWSGRIGGRRTTDTSLVQVYTNDMRSILAKRLYARTYIKLSHKHLGE